MRTWIPLRARLARALGLAAGLAALLLQPAGTAMAQPVGGDCARPGDPLTRLICGSEELRAVSVASARAFSALRQQEGRAAERGLLLGAAQAQADLLRACGMDVYAPNRVTDPQEMEMRDACILAGFRAQLSAWMARLTGAAREEATRPVQELEQAQLDLREIGLLDERIVPDGVYRTSTRQAILRWQRQAGRPETGLLGNEDAAALRAAAMTPAAQAPPAASPLVVTRLGEGALMIVPQVDLAIGQAMRFTPDEVEIPALGPGVRRVIFAEGGIRQETPDSLERLLATGWPEGTVLLLASEGGNPAAGLALGRMVRRAGLVTMIGRRGPRGVEFAGVRCFGACADMFLGGVRRIHANGSLYGVQRFRVTEAAPATTGQVDRTAQATHLAYVREMGVDSELLREAERADARHLNVLSPGRMAELGVLTAGGGHLWGVLTVSGQAFLRTHLGDGTNVHTAAFACGPRTSRVPLLYVNLRAGDVALLRRAVGWTLRVTLDGAEVEIGGDEVAGPPRVVDETLAFALRLTPRLAAELVRGRQVRVERVAADAGGRIGLDLDMSAGWGPVADFLRNCR